MESVAMEESEGKVHNGEPEPRNGNVNTVYFIRSAHRSRYTKYLFRGAWCAGWDSLLGTRFKTVPCLLV